jgi:hypothetical protein
MSIDSRLRNGLHGAAAAVTPDTASALREVRRRATRRRRTVFVARIAVAAAAAAVIFGAGPIVVDRLRAPDQVAPAAPTSLVGTYVVDVAEQQAARAPEHRMVGRWVVTLRADGVLEFVPPDGYPHNAVTGTYRVEGDLFRTNLFHDVPGCQLGDAGWRPTAGYLRPGTCTSSPSATPARHSTCCSYTNRGRSHRNHAAAHRIRRQRRFRRRLSSGLPAALGVKRAERAPRASSSS